MKAGVWCVSLVKTKTDDSWCVVCFTGVQCVSLVMTKTDDSWCVVCFIGLDKD